MIDIHTHVLPSVDDGASNEEEALRLAKAAAREGITNIVATPHHANGRYTNVAAEVEQRVRLLNDLLQRENIPVSISSGQEIRLHRELLEAWHRHELLTLAGSSYLLLELPSSDIPSSTFEFVYELRLLDLKPIIAHPERNAEIVRNPDRLAELVEAGAYAQVTTHSLLGGFGKPIERSAWTLCKSGLVHLVSSDAHHAERRGFRLKEAYDAIRERIGEPWERYYQDNAGCVLSDEPFGQPPQTSSEPLGGLRRVWSFMRGR
jgi:protein-tyrosine phosphatase